MYVCLEIPTSDSKISSIGFLVDIFPELAPSL